MSARADWSYVQARLQARHGERLDEAGWRVVEAAATFEHYLDRVRATALRRFTAAVAPPMPSHALERGLRLAWRRYVAEVAAWVPARWKAAVLWVSHVPDLPVLEQLLVGTGPDWIAEEPSLAPLREGEPQRPAAALACSSLAPLATAQAAGATVAARWFAHWRTLWPRHDRADQAALERLAAAVAAHVARLARARAHETSAPYRREIARALTRIFRASGGSPAGLFAHLALVAFDLERLRGGLVRRRLFAGAPAEFAS